MATWFTERGKANKHTRKGRCELRLVSAARKQQQQTTRKAYAYSRPAYLEWLRFFATMLRATTIREDRLHQRLSLVLDVVLLESKPFPKPIENIVVSTELSHVHWIDTTGALLVIRSSVTWIPHGRFLKGFPKSLACGCNPGGAWISGQQE